MFKTQKLVSLFISMLCFTVSYGNTVPSEASYKIPFDNSSGFILLEAEIDNQHGFFVFDTGADITILHQSLATQNAFSSDADSNLHAINTLTGTMEASRARVADIKLGNYSVSELEVYHSDLSQIAEMIEGTLFGVLGANVFSSQVLHINNDNRIIELYNYQYLNRNAKANQYYKVAMEVVNDMILVPLTIGTKKYQFALDTGSSVSLIDNKILLDNPFIKEMSKGLSINTAFNQFSSETYIAETTSLSQITINSLQFGRADMSEFETMPDDFSGILSIEQLPFTELIIDFSNNLLYFSF